MGKRNMNILLLVMVIFASFTLGFFTGRNYNHSPVQVSSLRSMAEASETTVPEETSPTVQMPPESTASPLPTEEPASEVSAETEILTEAPATEPTQEENGLININTASVQQLVTLPGIGEVLAQRIVDYRTANGPFPSVAALTNVKGIGEKRLAAILNLVTV